MEHEIEVYCDSYDEDADLYLESNYEVKFEFSAYYTPARINCRVEDSCPEEGDSSYEILTVTLDGIEVKLEDIDSEDRAEIHKEVNEWVEENGLQAIADDNDERRGEAQYDAQEDAADFYYERGY